MSWNVSPGKGWIPQGIEALANGLYASCALADKLNVLMGLSIRFSTRLELILELRSMKRPRLNIFAMDGHFALDISVVGGFAAKSLEYAELC